MVQAEQQVTSPRVALPVIAEQRLTLNNVSWETYEKILDAFGEHRAAHLTYEEGLLEFMVPSQTHETSGEVIGALIVNLAVECDLPIKSMASTTLRRKKYQLGAEPDKCFYLQHEPLVRGKTVDLESDPPPDLVLAVDITPSGINKNALYARLGIPEFWRFNGKALQFLHLQEDQYQVVETSPTFPWLDLQVIYVYLEQCQTVGEAQSMRNFLMWLRDHQPDSSIDNKYGSKHDV